MAGNVEKSLRAGSEELAPLLTAVEPHISALHAAALEHISRDANGTTTGVTFNIEVRNGAANLVKADVGGNQCFTASYPCGSTAAGGTTTCTTTVCMEVGPVTVRQ